MWTGTQVTQHTEVAQTLCQIKDQAFDLMRKKKNVSEYYVQQFILDKFKEYKLKTAFDDPIVAFNENTQHIHYYPTKRKAKKLKNNTLVMMDIWARQNKPKAPFGDITWMAYKGSRIPAKVQKVYNHVIHTREECLSFIKRHLDKNVLPYASSIDSVALSILARDSFNMLHEIGHSIGTYSPHGNKGWLCRSNRRPILTDLGYTIEPGIYIQDEFGVRCEMDFYVDKNMKLIITSEVQKDMVKL